MEIRFSGRMSFPLTWGHVFTFVWAKLVDSRAEVHSDKWCIELAAEDVDRIKAEILESKT